MASNSPLIIESNTIYLALTIRYPIENDPEFYHWILYLKGTDGDGYCVHANNRAGSFEFEAKPWRAATSQSLAALISIGKLKEGELEAIVELLRQIPIETPKEEEKQDFNCRIWIRQAIRVLNNKGILTCENIDALEKEAIGFANENRESVEIGGKAKIYKSSFSK